jgi:amino acid adenylation domain-containing protein
LLQSYVAEQAERRPEAIALAMGDERLSYEELATASDRLALLLSNTGCSRGDRVCLLADKTPSAIVAMLAALKVGCPYVPIDVASPVSRVARIVRSADPSAILVQGSGAALLEPLRAAGALPEGVPLGALDAAARERATERWAFGPGDQGEGALPAGRSDESDIAHILFTSGSTGEPKGVMITHANVGAFVEWANGWFRPRPEDRISSHPPLFFDLSTFDIYGTFRAGAELHMVPPETLLPRQLAEFISSRRLTQWFSVPSTMSYMARLDAVPDGGFESLERVIWCGEVLPTPVLAHWMRRMPQATYTNLYGPTEATIASSYYTVPEVPPDETQPIPIGTACGGEELIVFDERLAPVPEGEIGELYIGGAGLSPGYWRDPEKTSAAFVPDPRPGRSGRLIYRTGDLARAGADGVVHYLGRADTQIKSRGYRIELGEIEAALNALTEIAECAVVGVPSDGFEGTAICCAFVPANGRPPDARALRSALGSTLPAYMIPTRWSSMGVLPKTGNGKIDRRRLGERFLAGEAGQGAGQDA